MHKRALVELLDAVDEGVLAANQKVEDEKGNVDEGCFQIGHGNS